MATIIRKTLLHVETTFIEGGRAAPAPLKLIAAMAVVRNPWAGRGFVEDLKPEIHELAPVLGELLTKMIIDTAGSGEAVEGDVTLSSGDCALPTALGNQATAPVTAFQCAIARMRWMWVARAERL